MFERRHEALVSRGAFLRRMAASLAIAGAVVGLSLAVGVLGYRWLGGLSWIDALVNAAMILTGMGPVDPMRTTGAKLFAAGYALFAGLVFLTTFAIVTAPIAHRMLHGFHRPQRGGGPGE